MGVPTEKPKHKRNQMFAISGRGACAAITEYRIGLQADIGLDMDFGEPVQRCWIFQGQFTPPSPPPASDGDAATAKALQYHVLLALPDSSAVLGLPYDVGEAVLFSPDETPFDLTQRTVNAVQSPDGTIIQVTERSTTIITPYSRCVFLMNS